MWTDTDNKVHTQTNDSGHFTNDVKYFTNDVTYFATVFDYFNADHRHHKERTYRTQCVAAFTFSLLLTISK